MRMIMPALACLLLVGACSGKEGEDKPDAVASDEVASAPPKASPSAEPAVARNESVSNDLYEFEYAYPVEAATIPDLRKWLDADLEKQRADLIKDAEDQLAESKKEGYPFNPLGYWVGWQVVTDLPGFLSLSTGVGTYQGGAHPNHGFDALVWDRQANRKRDPTEFFTSKEALSRAIRAPFCRELDKQRAKKREGFDMGDDDTFTKCIDPTDSTIILGSSNRKAFDRIGVLVPPYEAGPYVEGDYEVTLPVTDAVMAAVKPEFRPTFVRAR